MSYNLIQNSPNLVWYIWNFLDPTDRVSLYPYVAAGTTNTAITANRLLYIPFVVPKDIVLLTLWAWYASTGAWFNVNVGIYSDNNSRPDTKLMETWVLTTWILAVSIEAPVSFQLYAGNLYRVACVVSGSTRRATIANGSLCWMWVTSTNGINTAYYEDLLPWRTTLPTTPASLTVHRGNIPKITASF